MFNVDSKMIGKVMEMRVVCVSFCFSFSLKWSYCKNFIFWFGIFFLLMFVFSISIFYFLLLLKDLINLNLDVVILKLIKLVKWCKLLSWIMYICLLKGYVVMWSLYKIKNLWFVVNFVFFELKIVIFDILLKYLLVFIWLNMYIDFGV